MRELSIEAIASYHELPIVTETSLVTEYLESNKPAAVEEAADGEDQIETPVSDELYIALSEAISDGGTGLTADMAAKLARQKL